MSRNFKLVYDRLSDSYDYESYEDGVLSGHITIQNYSGKFGYGMVESYIDKETYIKLIPTKKYLMLKTLLVDKRYRGRGIANDLMNKIGDLAKKFNNDFVVLEASPIDTMVGFTKMQQTKFLIEFYKKFGFRTIKIDNGIALMVLKIK